MKSNKDCFWVFRIEDEISNFFSSLDQNLDSLFVDGIDSSLFESGEIPHQSYELAHSQMFFDEPWCNLLHENEKLEEELEKGCHKYIERITALHGPFEFKSEDIIKGFSENQLDDWLFGEEIESFHYLSPGTKFWKTDKYYLFLSLIKEDKELPYELIIGRVLIRDLKLLLIKVKDKFHIKDDILMLS